MIRRPILLALVALVGSCGQAPRAGPTTVIIIESGPSPLDLAVCATTGRGLVRLDANGQIMSDLAARWAILEDGTDYIFRLEDGVAPKRVARDMRTLLAARANPLRPWLAPVVRVEAVTATVVEIRLSSPMPDLLTLLARPEIALRDMPGPMRVVSRTPSTLTLASRDTPGDRTTLAGERAGRAVARFAAGKVDAVLGGSFADLPIVQAATLSQGALILDPAEGLLGFARRSATGPAADRAVMRALNLAIDRDRIAALVGGAAARKATTIAGSTLEPPLAERITTARAAISAPLAIRVAMPDGPGARLLFALVAQDWRRIGVNATAVALEAPADLALIDSVVPPGEVTRIACAISVGCDQRDPLALLDPTFIPLLEPVRWSLIAPGIASFAENPAAAHPIELLRRAR